MALVLLLAGLGVALMPVPAHAAEDVITDMSVDFDIRADGTVAVRYEIDWQFGDRGRHGIEFDIVTRESWEADRTRDVLYDISDLRVSSPSGAPDTVTWEAKENGSDGSLDLRIGDPDETIDGREATYVITYVIRGALRTFDGKPEFYWDVTSRDNPAIDNITLRVTAPGSIPAARCLIGTAPCATTITDGVAVLAGGGVPSGTPVTVVAALAPDTVADAEPRLEGRRVDSPTLKAIDGSIEVTADGMTHVEQALTYLMPEKAGTVAPTLLLTLPVRRPFSDSKDQVFRIANLVVDGSTGPGMAPPVVSGKPTSRQDMTAEVPLASSSEPQTVRLSYDVAGAVATDGDTASARWVLAPVASGILDSLHVTWTMPADVRRARCLELRKGRDSADCTHAELGTTGNTIIWQHDGGPSLYVADVWVEADVDPAAVGNVAPILEPGLDAAARGRVRTGVGLGIAALVGSVAMVVLLGRIRVVRDRRWADVAPGLSAPAGSRVRTARRGDIVPVRFEEPECSLALAGLVVDGRPGRHHTAALLVHMAVQGAVRIQSAPLQVTGISASPLTEPLEREMYGDPTSTDTVFDRHKLGRMNDAVLTHQKKLLEDDSLFVAGRRRPGFFLNHTTLVWGFVVAALAWVPLTSKVMPGLLAPYGTAILYGTLIGCVAGMNIFRAPGPRWGLRPRATALRDQVEGFRHYIATAEANQLDFEAGQDIYRRYLPWAVLFGLTERWTRVCQELAASGRIPTLDTSFWSGDRSAAGIAGGMTSLASAVRSAGSASSPGRGGSGGSSGFSSRSSGGGGGGTSSKSW
ncbi:MAG: DUF2207 domain-containing protein [Arachnia sp.]